MNVIKISCKWILTASIIKMELRPTAPCVSEKL